MRALETVPTVMRGMDIHCGDVFAGEGICCVRDEQACLDQIRQRGETSCLRSTRCTYVRTLPTAPSPVTTHYEEKRMVSLRSPSSCTWELRLAVGDIRVDNEP